MADIIWKGALICEKSIKESKNGAEYAQFDLKETSMDKYPKTMRWFYGEEVPDNLKQLKKDGYADVTFEETKSMYQGKESIMRNIKSMTPSDAPKTISKASNTGFSQGSSYWGSPAQLADQRKIVRQSCMKMAISLLDINIRSKPECMEVKSDVLLKAAKILADDIINWVNDEGDDVKEEDII